MPIFPTKMKGNNQLVFISNKHIFWPIYEAYIVGNVNNILNQTTGYEGSEKNVEPLTHKVQPAGVPNTDPMVAIGEREE